MKFFNGHWEKKKGVSVYSPAQIYEWHKTEHELTFLAPHREIANRGMTLDGVVLTFHISVAREGVFHIVVNHYEGVKISRIFAPETVEYFSMRSRQRLLICVGRLGFRWVK